MKEFSIWFKGVLNFVWAHNETEARRILKEQYENA